MRGRVGIFPKDHRTRIQGIMSDVGGRKFEAARTRLAKLAKRETASDGDVVEALARGWPETAAYLKTPAYREAHAIYLKAHAIYVKRHGQAK